jgi:hypothetical protein
MKSVVNVLPSSNHHRRERTEGWQNIQHDSLWPEQQGYELLRPMVLFHEPVTKRAQETEVAERTVYRTYEI